MIHRQAKLSEDELKQVAHLDLSIQHWSAQHTALCLKAKALLDNIAALDIARKQLLDKVMKAANIDTRLVQQVSVEPDGTVNAVCLPPPPEAEQANGTAAPPAPEAPASPTS